MAWREALEEASSEDELDALNDQLNLARNKALQRIEQLLDEKSDRRGRGPAGQSPYVH